MPESKIGREYSPCEAVWLALADINPAAYTPNWRWQRLLWLDATVLAAWCGDNDLACPREWQALLREAALARKPCIQSNTHGASGKSTVGGTASSAAVSEVRLENWYCRRVEEWPADKLPPTEVQDEADARLIFSGLTVSRERLRRV